ncbi:hypothetical protein [Prosthecomicrobium sp. N25]|uniref:hypothetical protein n=1 Tax=Prosthecomicrobium sp. N25 TaxID=3129254 RepID=UPI0030772FC2
MSIAKFAAAAMVLLGAVSAARADQEDMAEREEFYRVLNGYYNKPRPAPATGNAVKASPAPKPAPAASRPAKRTTAPR